MLVGVHCAIVPRPSPPFFGDDLGASFFRRSLETILSLISHSCFHFFVGGGGTFDMNKIS